ncbi:MAG: hypothetical protein MI700_14810 [Balneolales bacterium]|nr:hypothetical protein [Balneolales bacterium]
MVLAILILIGAWVMNLFFPWWGIAIPGLILGYQFNKSTMGSLGWGFLGVFLLWGGQAFWIHIANDGILSTRIANMLGVGSPWIVILITAVLGGVVSGLATMTGSLFNGKGHNS